MALKIALNTVKLLSPTPDKTLPRFVTIGFSHYCEKARWGLDLSPLDYYEELHCPAMHLSTTLMELNSLPRIIAWSDDKDFITSVKSRTTEKIFQRKEKSAVPKLILPSSFFKENGIDHDPTASHGVISHGASGILKFLSTVYKPEQLGFIYPTGSLGLKILELESYLEKELASAASNWSFGNLLLKGEAFASNYHHHDNNLNKDSISFFLSKVTKTNTPLIEKLMLQLLGGNFLLPLMIKANHVNSKSRDDAYKQIIKIYSYLDDIVRYKTKGKFLFDSDYLTPADITLATMSLPILMPLETNSLFISLEQLNNYLQLNENKEKRLEGLYNMKKLASEIREKHISAQYALELYQQYRLPSSSLSSTTMKEIHIKTLQERF